MGVANDEVAGCEEWLELRRLAVMLLRPSSSPSEPVSSLKCDGLLAATTGGGEGG